MAYVAEIKPRKAKCSYDPYFAGLNAALKADRGGASAGIIDLDRLDSNVQLVCRALGNDYKLRLVAKSLPSLDLLRHLMQVGNTNRLMVFSEPFIAELLQNFPADSLDVLLGKPLPVEALPRLSVYPGWKTINWLIDTKQRLNDYLAFAKQTHSTLLVSLEIDVGLHRGGFETPQQLSEAVGIIKDNSAYLRLTGLMGYDGHVPYVPFYINKDRAIRKAFADVQKTYAQFTDVLKRAYDAQAFRSFTLNSGGSRTYFYYPDCKGKTPVNDIAMGSGFLAPSTFPELIKIGHQPALFLSSPILKKIASAKLPLAEKLSPIVDFWDPNLKVSYFMLGGGWPGEQVAPAGLQKNRFWEENDKGYSNLLPNQSILSSSEENDLHVGDFVFYHAWEGDGMLCFKKLILFRKGKIAGEWNTYDGGN